MLEQVGSPRGQTRSRSLPATPGQGASQRRSHSGSRPAPGRAGASSPGSAEEEEEGDGGRNEYAPEDDEESRRPQQWLKTGSSSFESVATHGKNEVYGGWEAREKESSVVNAAMNGPHGREWQRVREMMEHLNEGQPPQRRFGADGSRQPHESPPGKGAVDHAPPTERVPDTAELESMVWGPHLHTEDERGQEHGPENDFWKEHFELMHGSTATRIPQLRLEQVPVDDEGYRHAIASATAKFNSLRRHQQRMAIEGNTARKPPPIVRTVPFLAMGDSEEFPLKLSKLKESPAGAEEARQAGQAGGQPGQAPVVEVSLL